MLAMVEYAAPLQDLPCWWDKDNGINLANTTWKGTSITQKKTRTRLQASDSFQCIGSFLAWAWSLVCLSPYIRLKQQRGNERGRCCGAHLAAGRCCSCRWWIVYWHVTAARCECPIQGLIRRKQRTPHSASRQHARQYLEAVAMHMRREVLHM